MVERDPSSELKDENARLIALLEANGIQWRVLREPVPPASAPEPSRLSTDEKVALFRRLFRGRTDVYPIRWESKTTAKSGYSPACANEWRAGVCEKPRIKCGDCSNRLRPERVFAIGQKRQSKQPAGMSAYKIAEFPQWTRCS